jgi:hypothetical protein
MHKCTQAQGVLFLGTGTPTGRDADRRDGVSAVVGADPSMPLGVDVWEDFLPDNDIV